MKQEYDLIVVGGSFVGLSLLHALRNLNLKLALIEAGNITAKHSFPISLSLRSKCFLQKIGCWQSMEQSVNPIVSVHVSSKNNWGITRLNNTELNCDALGYVISSSDLLSSLYAEAKNNNNVTWFQETICEDIECVNNGVECRLNNNGITQTIFGKMVIGADGVNSVVRNKLAIPAITNEASYSALVAKIQLKRSHRNIAYQRFLSTGPMAMLPWGENTAGLVCCIPKGSKNDYLAMSKINLIEYLQDMFGYRLGKFVNISDLAVIPLSTSTVVNDYSSPALLLGNSANTLLPIAAQGLNLAFRDVEVFSELIKKNALSDIKVFIDKYQKARKSDHDFIKNIIELLNDMCISKRKSTHLLRNLIMFTLDEVHILKRNFAHKLMGYGMNNDVFDQILKMFMSFSQRYNNKVDIHAE